MENYQKKFQIREEIESLSIKYREEMRNQNNKDSVSRSYSKADRMHEQIERLERQLDNLQD